MWMTYKFDSNTKTLLEIETLWAIRGVTSLHFDEFIRLVRKTVCRWRNLIRVKFEKKNG